MWGVDTSVLRWYFCVVLILLWGFYTPVCAVLQTQVLPWADPLQSEFYKMSVGLTAADFTVTNNRPHRATCKTDYGHYYHHHHCYRHAMIWITVVPSLRWNRSYTVISAADMIAVSPSVPKWKVLLPELHSCYSITGLRRPTTSRCQHTTVIHYQTCSCTNAVQSVQ